MRNIRLAVAQMKMTGSYTENVTKAAGMAIAAAQNDADILLLPELFELPYFCQERNYNYYSLAETLEECGAVDTFRAICAECKMVIPVSFFEKYKNVYFNSVAMIDSDGKILGVYRKTHIPDDHFYQEKFYFSPGDTGFKVWDTKKGKIGVGICWDQWFPESARCMALDGAEIILYPTAIGSEPVLNVDSSGHWQRCMQGHAAANICPVAAANRIGTESVIPSKENNYQKSSLNFYGHSFITDETGEIITQADNEQEGLLFADIDLDKINKERAEWGVFRDRQPEKYKRILELS